MENQKQIQRNSLWPIAYAWWIYRGVNPDYATIMADLAVERKMNVENFQDNPTGRYGYT